MLIIIAAAVLVLAMAFFQAIQGMFSALIMAILTALCAAIAFGYYEPLAAALYETQPPYADAIALIALFVLPLLGLRFAADYGIRGNVLLGNDLTSVWIGRAIAGVLGLFSGMVLTGVFMIALQLLPVPRTILGYEPFDESLHRKDALAPFYPDEFTLGLVGVLSGGALGQERDFAEYNRGLLLDAYCRRNTADRNGRVGTVPGSIKVETATPIGRDTPAFKQAAAAHPIVADTAGEGGTLYRLEVRVSASARDDGDVWRLPGTHFRLVSARHKSYYPLAAWVSGLLDEKGKPLPMTERRPSGAGQFKDTDLLDRLEEPAMKLPEGERWDRARLIVCAKLPPKKEITTAEGKKRTVDAGWLRLSLLYRLDRDDKPAELVFRRIARDDVPPPRQDDAD